MKRSWLKRKSPLRKKGESELSQCKDRIQALLRAIAIKRDGGCVLRGWAARPCSGWNKKGELILQYDHLITRTRNISYGDPRLGVCICLGHHGWKHYNEIEYNSIIKEFLQ